MESLYGKRFLKKNMQDVKYPKYPKPFIVTYHLCSHLARHDEARKIMQAYIILQ